MFNLTKPNPIAGTLWGGCKMKHLPILLAVVLLPGSLVHASTPEKGDTTYKVAEQIPIKAYAFNLENVRLLDGPFKDAMGLGAQYITDLEPDRLLSRFREYAGLKPKGKIYGGWESRGISGHTLGHYLSACALMYAASGEKFYLDRANYIVDELALCQKANGNGYVGGIPRGKELFAEVAAGDIKTANFGLNGGWVPWYTMHKLYAGLVDAYRYCGNEKAKTVLIGLTDWACDLAKDLSDKQFQTMLTCEYGGMNDTLADVYALTGEKKYLALATRFNDQRILGPFLQGNDRLQGVHANTQIPKVVGAARQYELTGKEDYRKIVDFFWETVTKQQSFVNGGSGDAERFVTKGELWKHLGPLASETCGTYNMLKLTRHLFAWTAQGRYADYYERALYNHILVTQEPKKGMLLYFCSLKPGHFHTYSKPYDSFWCCTGSGLENHVKYGDSIFFHDDKSLYVNLFIASELTWKTKGLTVRQETLFPNEPKTRLVVSCEKRLPFAMKIRHPYWVAGPLHVTVNGKKVDAKSQPGGYLTIDRSWDNGDVVDVALPMKLRLVPMENSPSKVAIMYGPIVLAGELGREGMMPGMQYSAGQVALEHFPTPDVPVLLTNNKPVDQWVKKVPGKALRFKTAGVGRPEDVSLVPIYKAHHQRFTVYWDLFTEKQWEKVKDGYEERRRKKRELDASTVDVVTPDMQPERDHNFQGKSSRAGRHAGRAWRHVSPGGWFSYDMKVVADEPQALRVTYWGGDGGDKSRTFDIKVDGYTIATQTLKKEKPGEFFDVTYKIPEKFTKNKKKITVRFEPHAGNMGGGMYESRVVRSKKPTSRPATTQD